jgi:hypothetical protein
MADTICCKLLRSVEIIGHCTHRLSAYGRADTKTRSVEHRFYHGTAERRRSPSLKEDGQSAQSANVVSTNFQQPKQASTLVVSNPKSRPVPSSQAPTGQPIQPTSPIAVAFTQSKKPGSWGLSNPNSSPFPSTHAPTGQPFPIAGPTVVAFTQSKKPGSWGPSTNESSPAPPTHVSTGQPIKVAGPTAVAFTQSRSLGVGVLVLLITTLLSRINSPPLESSRE